MSGEDARTPAPAGDLARLQCHVLDPDDETTTLCGLSGGPLLVFLSDEVRLDDVSCPLCRRRADQEKFMAETAKEWGRGGTVRRPTTPDVMPLLVVFGLSGFFSTLFFPWITALLMALLAVVGTLLLLPSKER